MSIPTEQQLRTFFDTTLRPILVEIEKRKQTAMLHGGIVAVVILAVAGVVALMLGKDTGDNIMPVLVIMIGGVALAVFVFFWWVKHNLRDFKPYIIEPLVRFVDPSLTYIAMDGISQAEFQMSGMFRNRIDRYRKEDMILGTIDKTAIRCSEVHAEYKTKSRSSKGGTRTNWHTIFKGVYFIADFNKHFQGQTIVQQDVAENLFGSFIGKKLQGVNAMVTPGDLVNLEDPEFEKEFVVYSTDQIEARYILTPSLMRRMLEMTTALGTTPHFSFTGNNVHIAIPSRRNRFEPRIFGSVIDFDLILEVYRDILLPRGIVEELNLNTRIWTKK